MRIIAVGIGGAGSRIVASLYETDRKSSKVACVQGLAIDVDEESMKRLTALPENARMCFSSLEPGLPGSSDAEERAAPIDINEIVSRVQNMESGENDAIFLCCGLGGGMADVAPHIIAGLRSSVVEPIFGLVTLPCLAEGERISSKAADDIEMLSSLLDGIIVFDNETWYKKVKAQKAHLPPKEKGFAEKIGLKKSEKPLPPAQATYQFLNEGIVRRISLILRAGEFKADGGIDLAEVVLDSGEVLNTMKGMGFITIGYAVEKLPHDPLRFLSWLKPASLFDEEQKRKASRIVELAKQAIYHEISTPCDLTSAHKALVLVAGPSHELSMKGFMTVRKWIDRSIAGLETRSGDYPVMNTKNVAIIVMLSGLENIPRIAELKEVRAQSKPRKPSESVEAGEPMTERDLKIVRDDMISLPARKPRDDETGRRVYPREESEPDRISASAGERAMKEVDVTAIEAEEPEPVPPEIVPQIPQQRAGIREPEVMSPEEYVISTEEPQASQRRRVIVAHEEKVPVPAHKRTPSPQQSRSPAQKAGIPDLTSGTERSARYSGEEIPRLRETERQRIERELRRQRTVAIGGSAEKISPPPERAPPTIPDIRIIKRGSPQGKAGDEENIVQAPAPHHGEKRTIIIGKRKTAAMPDGSPERSFVPEDGSRPVPAEPSVPQAGDRRSVEIRDRVHPAKDEIFQGRGVRKPPVPQARDSILLHTELLPKKKAAGPEESGTAESRDQQPGKDPILPKKRIKSDGDEQDISKN